MIQGQLLAYAVLTLAERDDAPSDRRHMLTDIEIETLHKSRVDLPATCHQDPLDRLKGPKHHTMADPHQATVAHGLDHLRIEQRGLRQPAWLRGRALGGAPFGLPPL